MGMFHCDGCWDRPCTCGLEAKRAADLRRNFSPPNHVPFGETWDFPTVQEMIEHPDFMERKEWRRRKAEGKA